MLRAKRSFQWVALVAAMLQFALPPALAVADAIAQRDAGSTTAAHVEDHSQRDCRPGHPDRCVLCQTLSHWVAPPAAGPRVCDFETGTANAPTTRAGALPRVAHRTPHSRGPPA